MRRNIPFLLLIVVVGLSGCSTLQEFDQLTATQSKKEQLLAERLDRFSKAVYWGAFDEAGIYVTPEARDSFVREQKKRRREERLVDIEILDLSYEDNSSVARVEFQIRYFGQPSFHVRSRREQQTWVYDRFNGGWFFQESVPLADDKSEQGSARPHIPISMKRRS